MGVQARPDPDFPTVAFPNPEEPGAMDLALELASASAVSADLVIANDPDADRCAVGARQADGTFRMLTGDEVGGLLAEHVLRSTSGPDRLVATTIVSSSLLGRIAEAYGVRHRETLTGFKWIMKAGSGLIFGYEEALGYSVGSDEGLPVHDKDGIGAALTVAGIAAEAKQRGLSLTDLLDEQAVRYGLHATSQLSFRVDDLARITDAMSRLRANPPTELGGRTVESIDDLVGGLRRPAPDRRPALSAVRRRPGGDPAERDRAEAQVLPGTRAPGDRDRRDAGGGGRADRGAEGRPPHGPGSLEHHDRGDGQGERTPPSPRSSRPPTSRPARRWSRASSCVTCSLIWSATQSAWVRPAIASRAACSPFVRVGCEVG